MRISDWSSDVCSSDLSRFALACHGPWPNGPSRPCRRRHGPFRPSRGSCPCPPSSAVADRAARGLRHVRRGARRGSPPRSEEHTSELQSLMRISYAVFCLKKKKIYSQQNTELKSSK